MEFPDEKKACICDTCGKQFSNIYTLNAHKRQSHEKIKPYMCILCQKCFATKYKLSRHNQGIHSEVIFLIQLINLYT